MSWVGVLIGVSIAVVFISLVFLILWLFPDDGKDSRRVNPKTERTICSYKLQGDVDLNERETMKHKQDIPLGRRCPMFRREDDSRRSTVPGMDPSSNHVDDSHTIVIDLEGEEVHAKVKIKGENSVSATLLFDGPDRTIPTFRNGNINDISKAGSLHEFLVGLHKEYGAIASFWWHTEYTVSIASPELFKLHQNLFDRPVHMYGMLEPLLSRHSVKFSNGADGRLRRLALDKVFKYAGLGVYYDNIQKVAEDIANKWDKAEEDDHFPLGEHMSLFSVKAALISLLGNKFKDDREVMVFKHSFDVAWEDMEQRLVNPILPKASSDRAKNFKKALGTLREIITRALKERELHMHKSEDFLLIDAIIGHHFEQDRRIADVLTYIFGSFQSVANLLTWCIYYLCLHDDIQQKLHKEIVDVLGTKEPVTHQSIGKLKYLRQVLDETLRRSLICPWAARYSDDDMTIAGHNIPAGTPVVHALGVTQMDEKMWPAPSVFDPERFCEKMSKSRSAISFCPFGFAGGRNCPAYRFAYVEASVMLVTSLQKFKFLLVPGQDVKPHHGLVTHPKEEIWFKVTKRPISQTEA